MKITKSYLKQVIKEELQKEISLKDVGQKIKGFFDKSKSTSQKNPASQRVNTQKTPEHDNTSEFEQKMRDIAYEANKAYFNTEDYGTFHNKDASAAYAVARKGGPNFDKEFNISVAQEVLSDMKMSDWDTYMFAMNSVKAGEIWNDARVQSTRRAAAKYGV